MTRQASTGEPNSHRCDASATFHGRIFVVIGCAPLRGRQDKCGGRKERMPEGSEPRLALPDQTVIDDISRAPVAQLDRVSGYEPEGREFESLRARQINLARSVI